VNKRAKTLHDFADLKHALRQAAKQAQARAQAQAEAAAQKAALVAKQGQDHVLFAKHVGLVHRLPDTDRVQHVPARTPAQPLSSHADERGVLSESLSDDFDVATLLETDDPLAYRRADMGPDVLRKLRRGVWTLQGQLDLHGLRTEEARQTLGLFLKEAQFRGWRCVRVVHGKGLGSPGCVPVIKDKVKRWLVQSDRVLAFVQARGDEGGAGALIVLLQPESA
jgi:DNA-nicking Smr family endonuclease